MDLVENSKKLAAVAAVDEFVMDNSVIGIGSGSTIKYAIVRLAERVKEEGLRVIFVPTSFQSKELLMNHGLTIGELNSFKCLDVAIDGADEVDDHLNAIKGGGACQLQEKCVAAASRKFVICADYRKNSLKLGENWHQGIPLEVVPLAYQSVISKVTEMGANTVTLRMAKYKAGPVITDNGNFCVDANFGIIEPNDVQSLERKLNDIPGIICTGLFVRMACKAFFGNQDGTVSTRTSGDN